MADKKPGSPAKKASPKKPAKKTPTGAPAAKKAKKERPNKKPRNYALSTGVYRFSRSRVYHKKALYKFKGKRKPRTTKAKKPQFKVKEVGGEKNGGKRLVRIQKLRNYYPVAEKKIKKQRPAPQFFSKHKRTLRRSLRPGTVCILVAGPHRGKRVIFLKQLASGLLLVTGPFAINGCPMRRINKIYVIATKTKIDISKVKIPGRINDDYFRRKKDKRPKKGEGDIFAKKKEGYKVSDERKEDQKKIDAKIVKALRKNPEKATLRKYLATTFSLRSGQYPHRLKF